MTSSEERREVAERLRGRAIGVAAAYPSVHALNDFWVYRTPRRQAMNRFYCECPHCGKQFPVSWYWDTDKFAYLDDTVAEVVTDRDCLDATRAVYVVRRRCPYCGARLRVWHELVPMFYAFEEVDHDAD